MFYLCCFLFLLSSLFGTEKRIFGYGDVVLDFLAHVEDAFIDTVSARKGTCTPCSADHFEHVMGSLIVPYTKVPGGAAFNTIRLLALLGEKTAFGKAIGEDAASLEIGAYMDRLQIERRGAPSPERGVLKALCMITPDAERSFLATLTGSEETNPTMTETDWEECRWLHVDIWGLHRENWNLEGILQTAKDHHIPISMSLSSPQHVEGARAKLIHLISHYVDILFSNEDEAFALIGSSGEEACQALQKMCPLAIVTLGPRGCLIGSQKGLLHLPAFPVTAIDTTGAGDLFAGGFLYGYLRGLPLDRCARIGNFVASEIVQIVGAEPTEEGLARIRAFIHE